MSQCDYAGRRDGLDSTDEQDSIAGLLDTPSGCAQVGLKRKLKERIQNRRWMTCTYVCIALTTAAAYAFLVNELVKVIRA